MDRLDELVERWEKSALELREAEELIRMLVFEYKRRKSKRWILVSEPPEKPMRTLDDFRPQQDEIGQPPEVD